MPEIVGRVKCYECSRVNHLKADKKGRFYANCSGRGGCLSHHRYNPDIATAEDVPGFMPLKQEPARVTEKPVTEPVKPVTNLEKGARNDAVREEKGGNAGFLRW